MNTVKAVFAVCLALLIVSLPAIVSVGIFGHGWFSSRKTPCYFVRHYLSETMDKKAMPWERYYIFRSPCSGCANEEVYYGGYYNNTDKDLAYNFMVSWDLEACK